MSAPIDLGVAERVLRSRPSASTTPSCFDDRDGGAERGVDGEEHGSRVVGARGTSGKPFRPRRRIAIVNPLPHPLPLRTDGEALGLRRLVVPTSVGEVVVRAGRESGGPATILLHGAAGSWTTWTPLIAASDLSSAPLTDVIALDLPGWGESGGFDRVRCVEDVSDAVAEVARALGYSSWRLVGHSLGGFIALDVASRYPDATLGVTLISATGTGVARGGAPTAARRARAALVRRDAAHDAHAGGARCGRAGIRPSPRPARVAARAVVAAVRRRRAPFGDRRVRRRAASGRVLARRPPRRGLRGAHLDRRLVPGAIGSRSPRRLRRERRMPPPSPR